MSNSQTRSSRLRSRAAQQNASLLGTNEQVPSTSNISGPTISRVSPLLSPIVLTSEITELNEDEGKPLLLSSGKRPSKNNNNGSHDAGSTSSTDHPVREEEISVEMPVTPSMVVRETNKGMMGPNNPTYQQGTERGSDDLSSILDHEPAGDILRNRMRKTRSVKFENLSDQESEAESTPRLTSEQKGKRREIEISEEKYDLSASPSPEPGPTTQIEFDREYARDLAREWEDNENPGTNSPQMLDRDSPSKTVRQTELWNAINLQNAQLKKELELLKNSKSPKPTSAKSVKKNSSQRSTSGIPAKVTTPRIATPLVHSGQPLAFGVPIVNKPDALPSTSGMARAIRGDAEDPSGGSSDDSSKSDDERGNNNNGSKPTWPKKTTGGGPPNSPSSGNSSDDAESSESDTGSKIFRKSPDSDHASDSESTKKLKRRARVRHRSRLEKLKYQQAFLKTEPPFKYDGEAKASQFKKWVRESRAWIKNGRLSVRQGILNAGKYLTGQAYKYFERDVLRGHQHSSLEQFYNGLFDYLFPVSFREDQRDMFDSSYQGSMSGLTYLRLLEDLADTIGDIEEPDIVRAFTRRAKATIRSQLAMMGYRAEDLTLPTLEILIIRIERAIDTRDIINNSRRTTDRKESDRSTKKPWGRNSHQSSDTSNLRPETGRSQEQYKKPANKDTRQNNGSKSKTHVNERNAIPSKNNRRPMNEKKPWSKTPEDIARLKRLRDEHKCFECESPEHLSKDCPKRNNKRPPIPVHSIGLSRVEAQLEAIGEGRELGLFGISWPKYKANPKKSKRTVKSRNNRQKRVAAERRTRRKINSEAESLADLEDEAICKKIAHSLFLGAPYYYDVQTDYSDNPFDAERFHVSPYVRWKSYSVVDFHNSDSYVITREDVDKDLNMARWLADRKSSGECVICLRRTHNRRHFVHWENQPNPEYYESKMSPDFFLLEDDIDDETEVDSDPSDIADLDGPVGSGDNSNRGDYPDATSESGLVGSKSAADNCELDASALTVALDSMQLNGVTIKSNARQNTKSGNEANGLERTASRLKNFERTCPKPIIIVVNIDGQPCRALLDSGSWSDFISTTLADQLKVKATILDKPIDLQLAVSGSRGKIKARASVDFAYQKIKETRDFDVCNLESYDCILGTPFLFQHQVLFGLNPPQVTIRSVESMTIRGTQSLVIASRAVEVIDNRIDSLREELKGYAKAICKEASETPLPPLRAINHVIPLNDAHKVYSWRPSKCPEQLKPLWRVKRDDYLKTGRWEFKSGANAVPMMMLKKPSKDGTLRLRTVCDTRERNKNSRRLASPLPDIESILRNIVSHPYRSLLDGKDAYEQIRVEPGDVDKTLFATPDGTMVSLVMQIGDCNASATYQSLMNHIFSDFIGVFMDVYLDDICIYSDSPEEHVIHVKKVVDRLTKNKFFLSSHKLQFFMAELSVLGHVIDKHGIRMDPAKVDQVANWKVPTNKQLVSSFIGSVGYLAPGCKNVRIDMSVLSAVAAIGRPWKWSFSEQRAFENVKNIVHKWRDTRRVSIDYSPSGATCNLCCDASFTGGSGVLSQGNDWKSANVIAFWSGKFNPAQQNYPVHEQELLAIVESLKRFSHLLQGLKFRIYSDHKGLEWITTQRKLSPRQARWLEVLSEFDFEIIHIPGVDNILADSLSRLYSDEQPGLVRSSSEYVSVEEENAPSKMLLNLITSPMSVGHPVLLAAASLPLRAPSGRIRAQSQWRVADNNVVLSPVKRKTKKNVSGLKPSSATPNKRGRPMGSKNLPKTLDSPALNLEGERHHHTELTEQTSEVAMPETKETERELRNEEDRTRKEVFDASGEVVTKLGQESKMTSTFESDIAEEILTEAAISLPDLVSSGDPSVDIHGSIINKYNSDKFFKTIIDNPSNFKNFEVSNGLIFLKVNEKKILCIPDVLVGNRRLREILISHSHSILAHLGTRKTLVYLRENVWWKTISDDVVSFCKSCPTCATSKSTNHSPYGLLETLSVPSYPWETIGIDFVGPLPASTNLTGSYDMILVAICHLTSMVHLIPSKSTYRAKDIAELMFDRVYKLHGMPKNIVSDRDSLFTSTFWKRLNDLTGTELRMSSSFHPQTDGATERANRTMTQMLRQCVEPGQKNWLIKLPAVEFAMNSASSQTTGYAPFVLNNGRMPRSVLWSSESEYPGVRKFAQQTKDAILSAHDSIITARVKQTVLANKKRKQAPFSKGDLVYLSTANLSLPKGRARKLAPKFVGPYQILEDYKNNSFKLDLPSELKARGLHPNFHASLLRIHMPNDDRRFPGRQLSQIQTLGNVEEWAVSEIKTHHGTGADSLFLLEWKTGDCAWVSLDEVIKLEALTTYLEAQGIKDVKDLPKQISRSQSLPIACISITDKRAISGTSGYHPSKFGYRTERLGSTYDDLESMVTSGFRSQSFGKIPEKIGLKDKNISINLQYSPPFASTYKTMCQSLNPLYVGVSKNVIAKDIAKGILTPDNFILSPAIAEFLENDRTAFGLHLGQNFKYAFKSVTFNVSGRNSAHLLVPTLEDNSSMSINCKPIAKFRTVNENHLPNRDIATRDRQIRSDHCSGFGIHSLDSRHTLGDLQYPDHLHLSCLRCSKAFTRKALSCPACTHPLDVPVQCLMVNMEGCGYLYAPELVVLGGTVKYINIPSTSLKFACCSSCDVDIGNEAIEIPCHRCREFGFPPVFSEHRSSSASVESRSTCQSPFPKISKRVTWDDVKPPVDDYASHSFTKSRDVRSQRPIPTGPRNKGTKNRHSRRRTMNNNQGRMKRANYQVQSYDDHVSTYDDIYNNESQDLMYPSFGPANSSFVDAGTKISSNPDDTRGEYINHKLKKCLSPRRKAGGRM